MKQHLALSSAGLILIFAASALQAQTAGKALPTLAPAAIEKIDAAIPATAPTQPQESRRLLVFWRCEGFFHGTGIAGGNRSLELMGRKTGAFTADFSDDYAVFAPANLARYDAVVFNNTTHLKFKDPIHRQAILDFAQNRKGIQVKAPYTRSDRRVLMSLDLSDPVTGGVTNGVKRTDKDFAVAWIKPQGRGRVFYCSLGHAENVFQDPNVVRFYLAGIQYALGDLPVDASPR